MNKNLLAAWLKAILRTILLSVLLLWGWVQTAPPAAAVNQKRIYFPLVYNTNHNPYTPSHPFPADKSMFSVFDLRWNGGDPDGDPVTYSVYLDTQNPPLKLVGKDVSEPDILVYKLGLKNKTTYYWRVIARDSHGATTSGPIWSVYNDWPGCICR
jgi:hypothetical protein